MAQTSDAYPVSGPYIGNPPPEDGGGPPPQDNTGGLTDDQIKARFPWVPWAQLAGGGKAVLDAFRNAMAAGTDPLDAAWAVLRDDPAVQAALPGYNEWATATAANTGKWQSVLDFTAAKTQAAINVDTLPAAIQNIFNADQLAVLRSGNIWAPANRDLFGFFAWAQQNFHYYSDPQFSQYHGAPTYAMLHAAYEQGISGSDLQYQWSVQAQNAANAAAEQRANAQSAQNQAEAEARQEAQRKQRIEDAATRIEAGYDPSIRVLFTPDELHNAAIWEAGGEWGDAKAAKEIALASPVNQYFQHFYGRAPTRAEIDQYYASGATPEYINQTLDSMGIQRAFPTSLTSLFTPDEIKAYSDEKAGIHTPDGKRIADLVDLAMSLNPIYNQYQNRAITRQELEGHLNMGDTPQKVAGTFGGQAFIGANKQDIQYYQGAFGEGQLSQQQLDQLGQNEAGYTTPQGALLQSKFEKAMERARVAFSGTLAHMERSNRFGQQQLPDLGA